MAGPWEAYAAPAAAPAEPAGPWSQYAVKTEPTFVEKLGQTWPAKVAKSIASAVTLPGDVYAGRTDPLSEEGIGRATELATVATPMVPRAVSGLVAAAKGPPTAEAIKTAAGEGYTAARNLGVDIKPESVANSFTGLRSVLETDGINAELAPKTFSIIGKVVSPPKGAVATISNLETVRRTLGNAAKDFANPTEQMAAKRAIEHLDDYLAGIRQGDVLAGDATRASSILGEARGNYAAAKRSEQITDKLGDAELAAAAANSGQNLGNATRQKIKSILTSDRLSRGYSADEIAQMEQVVKGTATGNMLRKIGNLLGGGGGMGAAVSAGVGGMATAASGGWGALAPVVGALLKQGERASTARQVKMLDELVRSRSPLAQASESNALTTGDMAKRAAIVRALLASQTPQMERSHAP